MTRYSDRSSDRCSARYTDRARESIGLALCSQRVESREQRVESREYRNSYRYSGCRGRYAPLPTKPLPDPIGGYELTQVKQVTTDRARADR